MPIAPRPSRPTSRSASCACFMACLLFCVRFGGTSPRVPHEYPRASAPRRASRDLMGHANTARPARNPAVDFYRVSGVILIVLGHWLAGAVTYRDGVFGQQNPLVDQPWTQSLDWS